MHALGASALTGVAVGAGLFAIGYATRSSAGEDLGVALGGFAAGLSTIIGIATGAVLASTKTEAWDRFDPSSLAVRPTDQ